MHFPAIDEENFLGWRKGPIQPRNTTSLGFPESFQRTSVEEEDNISDNSSTTSDTPSTGVSPSTFPRAMSLESARDEAAITSRPSRSNVMRLENILNGASIGYDPQPRSRSLGRSPAQEQFDALPSSCPLSSTLARSHSPEEVTVKKKKVKMHRCPECQKDFPRPSGLRTHMNMHTREKPFHCSYPGCTRTFSVVSNAKRHMRTHGIGVSVDDSESTPVPYVVGFEAPVVIPQPDLDKMPNRKPPTRLRWIPLAAEGRWAVGSPTSTSSTGDSPSIPDLGILPTSSLH